MTILKYSKQAILVILLLFMGTCVPGTAWSNIDYDVVMYKNDDAGMVTTRFSTHDRIVIRVKFKHLPKGRYTFQADWYNPLGEVQDTSRSNFTIESATNVVSESRLELLRASALRRFFSTSETTGYHIKFYGLWKVKVFLNGKEITHKEFEVR